MGIGDDASFLSFIDITSIRLWLHHLYEVIKSFFCAKTKSEALLFSEFPFPADP